eukprot:COSAG04_NODE_6097_length_1412_cov_1.048743_3_plen_36_part_01
MMKLLKVRSILKVQILKPLLKMCSFENAAQVPRNVR